MTGDEAVDLHALCALVEQLEARMGRAERRKERLDPDRLAAIEARVAAVEKVAKVPSVDDVAKATAAAVEPALRAVEVRLAEIEQRGALTYEGVYDPAKSYRRGVAVTHGGSLWVARADQTTTAAPGRSPDWQLAAKRGRDGRDARPKRGETTHER